jgi:hypothetical protein
VLADRTSPHHTDGSTNGSRGSKGSLRHVTREPPAEHGAFNDSAIALRRRREAECCPAPTPSRRSQAAVGAENEGMPRHVHTDFVCSIVFRVGCRSNHAFSRRHSSSSYVDRNPTSDRSGLQFQFS